jgi:hypothetical protein
LVEYDPGRIGTDSDGIPMHAHVVTTPNKARARVFPSLKEALELWRQESGLRPDGLPNRPLTAFSITFESTTD